MEDLWSLRKKFRTINIVIVSPLDKLIDSCIYQLSACRINYFRKHSSTPKPEHAPTRFLTSRTLRGLSSHFKFSRRKTDSLHMRNKRRLYDSIPRKATEENWIKFHIAFLLLPKNPKVNSSVKFSKLFHVKYVLTSSGKPIWTFVVEEVQARPAQLEVVGV